VIGSISAFSSRGIEIKLLFYFFENTVLTFSLGFNLYLVSSTLNQNSVNKNR